MRQSKNPEYPWHRQESQPFRSSRTVEFAKDLEGECLCEYWQAQMQMTGMLDALVVTPEDFVKIKADHPEFLDAVLQTDGPGNSHFSGLTVSDDLPQELENSGIGNPQQYL